MLCHSKGEKCVVEAKSGSRVRVKWVGGLERSLTEKGSGDGVSWWQGGMSTALRTDPPSVSLSAPLFFCCAFAFCRRVYPRLVLESISLSV